MVSVKAGEAVVKLSVPSMHSSPALCSLLAFTLNIKVCLALGSLEPSQIKRDQLSRLLFFNSYNFLKFTYTFIFHVLSFHHLEEISVRYFFHKIMPYSIFCVLGFFGFCLFCLVFLKSLLLAKEHGGVIGVYSQSS